MDAKKPFMLSIHSHKSFIFCNESLGESGNDRKIVNINNTSFWNINAHINACSRLSVEGNLNSINDGSTFLKYLLPSTNNLFKLFPHKFTIFQRSKLTNEQKKTKTINLTILPAANTHTWDALEFRHLHQAKTL